MNYVRNEWKGKAKVESSVMRRKSTYVWGLGLKFLMSIGCLLFPYSGISAAVTMNSFGRSHLTHLSDTVTSHKIQQISENSSEPQLNDSLYKEKKKPQHGVDIDKKHSLKLNQEAVKLIQFDFTSNPMHEHDSPKAAPMEKSWMDFQVDLAIPKNMLDSTKVRKPNGYIRMLPYSIWTRFGEDPVFDVLVFGNEKRLKVQWSLNLDLEDEEYGRNLQPAAGRIYENTPGSSVVIQNLDIIGFLYDNLNKHGRMLKRNRKRAKAWKNYQSYKTSKLDSLKFPNFYLATEKNEAMDSCAREAVKLHEQAEVNYHQSQSIRLLDYPSNMHSTPDYRLLQTPEMRSRFGTFPLENPFEAHPDSIAKSLAADTLDIEKVDTEQNERNEKKKDSRKKGRKHMKKRSEKTIKETEELPDNMEDLYKYIRMKQAQDSIRRKEFFRKDKVSTDVYETEKQQRRFKERQE